MQAIRTACLIEALPSVRIARAAIGAAGEAAFAHGRIGFRGVLRIATRELRDRDRGDCVGSGGRRNAEGSDAPNCGPFTRSPSGSQSRVVGWRSHRRRSGDG